jgi:hypothetical protein
VALYVADLSTTTGWTERWGTTEGSVAANTSPTRLTVAKSAESNEYGISLNAVDSDADRDDVEVLAKVRFNTQATATNTVGVFLRGSGTSGAENLIAVTLRDAGNDGSDFQPIVYDFSSGSAGLVGSSGGSNVAATWYWIRARANGTSLKARVWLDGTSEPTTWDVDDTTAVAGVGWVGLYAFDTATDTYDLGYFAAATGGDTINLGGSARVQFIGV